MSSGAGPSESICLANISAAYRCVLRLQRKYVTLSRTLLVHQQCGPGRDEPKILMIILFIPAGDWTRGDENIPPLSSQPVRAGRRLLIWSLAVFWAQKQTWTSTHFVMTAKKQAFNMSMKSHMKHHSWHTSLTSSRNPCFIIEAPAFSKVPERGPNPPSDRELCLTRTWAPAHVLSTHIHILGSFSSKAL